MRAAWGLAAMLRRAMAACSGSTSRVVMRPPSGSPAAMAIDEYPVKVPISSTCSAPVANTTSSRNRPSSRPTIMNHIGWSRRVSSSTCASHAGGKVECSSA